LNINSFSNSESATEAFKSKVKTTFDDTLFTICPPAPQLLIALYCSSESNLFISIIVAGARVLINHLLFSQD
jgi:hypothetical protein